MFGIDKLTLSKPKVVKTTAHTFINNINNVAKENKASINNIDSHLNKTSQDLVIEKPKLLKPVANNQTVKQLEQKIDMSKANIENIRSSKPSISNIRPVAKTFLNQVNKINSEQITSNIKSEKLVFSYSDEKGKSGTLENTGSRLKLFLYKKHNKDYIEEKIEIYSLSNQLVKQNGLFIQVKGWGNTKELSIANALKKAIDKFVNISNYVIIYNYIVASMSPIIDGGWECKIKITPGKL